MYKKVFSGKLRTLPAKPRCLLVLVGLVLVLTNSRRNTAFVMVLCESAPSFLRLRVPKDGSDKESRQRYSDRENPSAL
jgi:hypothetical protein